MLLYRRAGETKLSRFMYRPKQWSSNFDRGAAKLSMGWVNPWVELCWVELLGWVEIFFYFWWVELGHRSEVAEIEMLYIR